MPPVTIPQFNHHTIQQILERNQGLLNMIKECQDNGWMDDAKIYQKRLMSNISFLGCLSDAVVPLKDSPAAPHLPHGSSIGRKNNDSLADHQLALCYYPDLPASRQDIIDSLPAPIMVKVPETKEKVESKNYVPVLPLVGNNYERDVALSKLVLVDPIVSRSILMSRLVPCTHEKIHNPPSTSHLDPSSAKSKTKTTPMLATHRSRLNNNGPSSFISPGLINSVERGGGGGNGKFGSNNTALALFSDLAQDESDLSDDEYKQPEEDEDEEEEDEDDEDDEDSQSQDLNDKDRDFYSQPKFENSTNPPLANHPEARNQELENDYLSVFHNSSSLQQPNNQNIYQQQQPTFYGHSLPPNAAEGEMAPYFGNHFDQSQQQQSFQQILQPDSLMPNANVASRQVASSSTAQFQQGMHMLQQPPLASSVSFPLYQDQQRLMSDVPLQQNYLNEQQSQVMQPPPPPSLVQQPPMNQLDLLTMQLQALPPQQQLLLIQQLTQRVQQQQSALPSQNVAMGVVPATNPNVPMQQYQYMLQQPQQRQSGFENPQVSFNTQQMNIPHQQPSHLQQELEIDDFFRFEETGDENEEDDGDNVEARTDGACNSTEFCWD